MKRHVKTSTEGTTDQPKGEHFCQRYLQELTPTCSPIPYSKGMAQTLMSPMAINLMVVVPPTASICSDTLEVILLVGDGGLAF